MKYVENMYKECIWNIYIVSIFFKVSNIQYVLLFLLCFKFNKGIFCEFCVILDIWYLILLLVKLIMLGVCVNDLLKYYCK